MQALDDLTEPLQYARDEYEIGAGDIFLGRKLKIEKAKHALIDCCTEDNDTSENEKRDDDNNNDRDQFYDVNKCSKGTTIINNYNYNNLIIISIKK